MSAFYYVNNEVLLPAWRSPEGRRFPWLLLLALLALLGLGAGAWWWSPSDRDAQQAVVLGQVDLDGDGTLEVQGSGIIIHPTKGYILTNKHLVWGQQGRAKGKIEIVYLSGSKEAETMEASLEAYGEGTPGLTTEQLKNDWAILKVERKEPLPFLALDEGLEFQEEEAIKAYGFPRAEDTQTNKFGSSVKVLHGILSRVDRNDQGAVVRLTHDAKCAPGMSGGPITRGGKVIGMNTLYLLPKKLDGVDPNENYALPTCLILEQIKNFRPGT